MSGSQDEIPPPPPPPPSSSQTPTQQTPHTVSTIKLHILKKGEYDIWAMKMEHYLAHADYPIWEVIQNGNGPVSITTDTQGQIKVLPPRTVEEIVARERERKARTTLLMALPEDQLAKFHKMTDAKEMWEAIKSRFEGLHKGYERFQSLLSQLEIHGAGSYENDGKGFYCISLAAKCSIVLRTPALDEFDLEEMVLKWQVAMISMRMKKFYKKTGRKLQFDAKEPVGFDKTKVECYNCHNTWHFARECRTKGNQDSRRRDAWNSGNKDGSRTEKKEDSKALVTIDGEGVDWTSQEDEDYALMACNSSGSDTEVTSCSNECKESYAKLKKLYDAQRGQLSDASIEIKAYTQGLKKVEAQLVAHQQGKLWYEQKIKFIKIDLDDKTDVLTYHKKLFAEAMKEKEDLKAKVEKWHNSSKNLVLQSVFKGKESDFENPPLYDRFVTAGGMNAVPPPMTGNYMPYGPDIEIDYSQFTYGPKQTQPSESETLNSEFDTLSMNQIVKMKETVKNHFTHSKNSKLDRNSIGYGFTARACFVCGSLNHLIRDYDFHEKRMAKQVELNNRLKSAVGGKRETDVKPSAGCNWRPQRHNWHNVSKYNGGSSLRNFFAEQGIVDSGCSRHMTGNKAYLAEYQDFNGGPVAFGGSKGYINGKGIEDIIDAGDSEKEDESAQDYFVLLIWSSYSLTIKRSRAEDANAAPHKHPNLKTDEKPVDKEDQVFLDELERLKRQEKDANDAAEALRKEFAQQTEDLLLQAGAAKPSSTNIVNTASTPVSTAST
ncbi:ribonuclease H-like domain-containing protein [Tanacetum coccineum]